MTTQQKRRADLLVRAKDALLVIHLPWQSLLPVMLEQKLQRKMVSGDISQLVACTRGTQWSYSGLGAPSGQHPVSSRYTPSASLCTQGLAPNSRSRRPMGNENTQAEKEKYFRVPLVDGGGIPSSGVYPTSSHGSSNSSLEGSHRTVFSGVLFDAHVLPSKNPRVSPLTPSSPFYR